MMVGVLLQILLGALRPFVSVPRAFVLFRHSVRECKTGVGTRFVASVEAGATKQHKNLVLSAGYEDAVTTVIYTGRPLRVRNTPYVKDWNENRAAEIKELTSKGIIPHERELEKDPSKYIPGRPWLMGRISALIHDVLPAKAIVNNMVNEAAEILERNASLVKVSPKPKL
jgi:NAD(P)H-dependent flavin oxidoreductase YrpB (nitropropane dioxygenase family)